MANNYTPEDSQTFMSRGVQQLKTLNNQKSKNQRPTSRRGTSSSQQAEK